MTSADVRPISPGFPATLHCDLDPVFFDLFCRAPRLTAQVRATTGEELFAADSAAETILRTLPHTVSIVLPVDATSRMEGLRLVVFEIVGHENGERSEVPGLFSWPVN